MNNITHPKRQITDTAAMALSLAIHGLVFLIVYYLHLPAPQTAGGGSSQPYTVELDLKSFHTSARTLAPPPAKQIPHSPTVTHTSPKAKTPPQKVEEQPPAQVTENQPIVTTEEPVIDTRGLYTGTGNGKKAGASLEMAGWIWDSVPDPQDNTDEIGKLVFEIVIDDTGEIIGIKTLEKTVTPLIEQLYKEEVAKLTFSKTSKKLAYASDSTGRITFILQYK